VRLLSIWIVALALAAAFESEDSRAVQAEFRKQDATLDWFQVLDKKPIDASNSLMLVAAAPSELRPGASVRSPIYLKEQIGLFVVAGPANGVRLALDRSLLASLAASPVLEPGDEHTAYIHLHSNYGFYRGSIKYVFDLANPRQPQKIRYGALAFTSAAQENGALRYRAVFPSSLAQANDLAAGWKPYYSIITIEPRDGELPAYRVVETAPHEDPFPPMPAPMRLADGQTALVVHTSSLDQPAHAGGIDLTTNSGRKLFWPVHVPNQAQYRAARPDAQQREELENNIGPHAASGTKLWFASTFYDGEGVSGVGAIGSFDAVTHAYILRYLPEITHWSGSALLVDGRDVWVGLMRRPEGVEYSGGLLRFNMDTNAARTYPVRDLIYTLNRVGDTLYCGTAGGVYTIRGDQVTQLRFEPDAQGKLNLLAREVK